MKKLTLLLSVVVLLGLNGCGAVKGLLIYDTDPTLKPINNVHALATMNAVGFEWERLKQKRLHGINIYRGLAKERFLPNQHVKHIGTVDNRYATHFVDTHVKPNTAYLYTFTTFYMGKESKHGKVLKVKTPATFKGVSFVQAYKVAPYVVKLLWQPHSNESVNSYVIERSVNGGEWKFVAQVEGRLMVEYIDSYIQPTHRYQYRILAKRYDGIVSRPSPVTKIAF
jgi:hypothetical protein